MQRTAQALSVALYGGEHTDRDTARNPPSNARRADDNVGPVHPSSALLCASLPGRSKPNRTEFQQHPTVPSGPSCPQLQLCICKTSQLLRKHRTGCTTAEYRGQQRPRQKKRVRIAECPALQLSRMAGLRAFLSGRGRVPHNLFSSCGQIEGYHVGRTVGTYHVTMAVAVEVPWERTGTDSDPGAGAVLLCSARRFTMSSLELALDPRLDPELL